MAAPSLSIGWQIAIGLLVFSVAWLLQIESTSLTAPKDNLEQLTWVHSLEWGYYKHPPLPTWLFSVPVSLLGLSARTSYITGALFTAAGMLLFWKLLQELRGNRHATLALLAALCITYYNERLHFFNHEVVLMPFFVGSALLAWRAFCRRQLRWWAALGCCLGLGALAKYQMILAAVAVFMFWLASGAWRERVHVIGLGLAAAMSLAILSPHLYWLFLNDFGPLRYASESSLGASLGAGARLFNTLHWLADQLLNRALLAWVLLGLVVALHRKKAANPHEPSSQADPDHASRALILCFGLTPLVLTCAIGLAAGSSLQLHWGTPFLLLAIPAAMELAGARLRPALSRISLRTALKCFVVLQLALLLIAQMTSARSELRLNSRHWRNFDSKALSRALAEPAREALGGDIRVIAGPTAEARALSLKLRERPLVLIDGRLDISPWVTQHMVEACGVLHLQLSATQPPGHQPVGEGFPHLYWRVSPPLEDAGHCPQA
jgi:4-amino-4-deoxy-L-arabinose transferase-like glycosyltransferase